MSYNIAFSVAEDCRLPGAENARAVIYNVNGSVYRSSDNIALNSDVGDFVIDAGQVVVGDYTYAIFRTNNGVNRVIQSGELKIYAGAVQKSALQQELEVLETALSDPDSNTQEIYLPDGRRVRFRDRAEMSRRADVIRHKLAIGGSQIRAYNFV